MKCQTVIAGIGGQGVLFAAKILTEIARRREIPVLGSQTFGMAQRGGSVTTHLKMGEFESPLICEGDADLLLALDAVEAHRTLPFLRNSHDGGPPICVVNARDDAVFPDSRVAELVAAMGIVVHRCNADREALAMKLPLVANLVLLGFAASQPHFPFAYDEVADATAAISGPHRASNLEALQRGRALYAP